MCLHIFFSPSKNNYASVKQRVEFWWLVMCFKLSVLFKYFWKTLSQHVKIYHVIQEL